MLNYVSVFFLMYFSLFTSVKHAHHGPMSVQHLLLLLKIFLSFNYIPVVAIYPTLS